VTPPASWSLDMRKPAERSNEMEQAARKAVAAKRKVETERRPLPPKPLAQWDFESDASDTYGTLPGTVEGVAKFTKGAIVVDGRTGFVASAPLTQNLSAKTLEAWVQLGHLEQRAGGVIGVETLDGKVFDTIVFGEKQPKRWIAGSNNFARTQAVEKVTDESDAMNRPVHLAAVYAVDGTIRLYREGQPYGEPYKTSGPATFSAGMSHVVLGLRHSPSGGNKMLDGKIETARLYDRALSPEEVEASFRAGVSSYVSEAELLAELKPSDRQQYATLKVEVEKLVGEVRDYRERKTYAVTPQKPPLTQMLVRGNVQQPGETLPPAGIASLAVSDPILASPRMRATPNAGPNWRPGSPARRTRSLPVRL